MAEFLAAYKKTAATEGGYVNDPSDNGGETYGGISRKFHPEWEGWRILDTYKPLKTGQIINDTRLESAVRTFYYRTYWQPINGNAMDDQAIAEKLYDIGVNRGQRTTIKDIQEVLGIPQTGNVDAATIEAINNPAKYLV